MPVIRRAQPPSRCAHRSKRTGAQCRRPVKPGRKHCPEHCKELFGANSAEAEASRKRYLKQNQPAGGANQHTSRNYTPNPEEIAARALELADQCPVRDDAGRVPPAMERIARTAGAAVAELDWLAARTNLTQRHERRRELLERRLDGYFDRLGLSARSLLDLEPMRLRRKHAAARSARPVQDPDHSRRVLAILAQSGALGREARAYADDHGGELAFFEPEERAALLGVDLEPVEEPIVHTPEPPQLVAVDPEEEQ